ncbi:MAG: recombinase family protein [Thermomicrobiales bacterium]
MTTNHQPTPSIAGEERRERRGSFSQFGSLFGLEALKEPTAPGESSRGDAVLYLRVSTQRQMHTAIDIEADGNSIATQREATRKRAKQLKASIVAEFVEPGQSAQSVAKRKQFQAMLTYIETHPEVRYVVIYMRSRVFRNQTDAAITKRILANMGVTLISAKEEFGEGYMADAMEAITDIMNEVQVRQSGEDISNKMLHKAQNGGTTGRAPLGYLNVRKDIDGHLVNTIDIDPKRGPLVTWAFEQYATGDYSLVRLQQELADRGFTTRRTAKWEEKPVSRSQIALILRDPYYLGMIPYKGQVYPGRHAALVTSELFERVQQVLDVRMRRNQRDIVHTHFLRGMLRCGRCHSRQLIFSQVTNPQGTMYDYFLCAGRQEGTCDLPHLPVALVEEAMQREVASPPTDTGRDRDDARGSDGSSRAAADGGAGGACAGQEGAGCPRRKRGAIARSRGG